MSRHLDIFSKVEAIDWSIISKVISLSPRPKEPMTCPFIIMRPLTTCVPLCSTRSTLSTRESQLVETFFFCWCFATFVDYSLHTLHTTHYTQCLRLRDFDTHFTCKIFGYETVEDYYQDASSAFHIQSESLPSPSPLHVTHCKLLDV